ncbi:MAG: hypothetical protein R3360_03515, partial [Alphaproteobacteria bacterium]|nr:hypothetical protein [Alphaproteobacteria bacterium]
ADIHYRGTGSMAQSLLTTKLTMPPLRPNRVTRNALLARLDEGLHIGHALTLVSAPAGFGKTTLLSDWCTTIERDVAWLSLDEGDSDLVQFLNYIVAALQTVDSSIGRGWSTDQLDAPQPPVASFVTHLINNIAAADRPLILVLDDYHHIRVPTIHQVMAFLVENLPPTLHVALGTREDPPLPLPRLRVRDALTEIRQRDLRFTPAEAAAFLNETMHLDLAADAVAALEARTEGWIAGLQLAALALHEEATDAGQFIDAFTGDDRYVMDYLISEVLERQPEATRAFLQQTAILDRLTAPLCEALTGRDDSAAILEMLDQSNLFVVPLDNRREWYRYHRLFTEVLRAMLNPNTKLDLHRRAAMWFDSHGYPNDAVQHALAAGRISGDLTLAEDLIRTAAEDLLHAGNIRAVRGWLSALPRANLRADGSLALLDAWAGALTGDLYRYEQAARAADKLFEADGSSAERGKLLALRAFVTLIHHQDYEQASEIAASSLDHLSSDQPRWRVIARWVQAEAVERTGHIKEAIEAFREARRVGLSVGDQIFVATVEMSLALALNNAARRPVAVHLCEESLARYEENGRYTIPVAALLFSRLGELHYEANHLDESRRCHERALQLGDHIALGEPFTFARGVYARTLYALGEIDAAFNTLAESRRQSRGSSALNADWLAALTADLRLRQGDLAAARRWANDAGIQPGDQPDYMHLDSQMVLLRLLLAEGRIADARQWLADIIPFLQDRGLVRWLITARLLEALAADRADGPFA